MGKDGLGLRGPASGRQPPSSGTASLSRAVAGGTGCRQESILLDPLNTEDFCKGNRTTSTCEMHSLEGAELSVQSTFTSTHYMPETRRRGPEEIPLVCATGFQSHPCQTDNRPKRSKPRTTPRFTDSLPPWLQFYKGFDIKSHVTRPMDDGGRVLCHFCRTATPLMLFRHSICGLTHGDSAPLLCGYK